MTPMSSIRLEKSPSVADSHIHERDLFYGFETYPFLTSVLDLCQPRGGDVRFNCKSRAAEAPSRLIVGIGGELLVVPSRVPDRL